MKVIARCHAHRAGGEKIRLGDDPSWTWIDFFILRRGAHRAGGYKIRLGDDPSRTWIEFLFSAEALAGLEAIKSVSEMIRLGPWSKVILAGGGKNRLGPWLRRGAHWAGGERTV